MRQSCFEVIASGIDTLKANMERLLQEEVIRLIDKKTNTEIQTSEAQLTPAMKLRVKKQLVQRMKQQYDEADRTELENYCHDFRAQTEQTVDNLIEDYSHFYSVFREQRLCQLMDSEWTEKCVNQAFQLIQKYYNAEICD